jgi:hypothetical protein
MVKIRVRKKKDHPIHAMAGDKIILRYNDVPVLGSKIDKEIEVNELVIFDIEEGDFSGATEGIGGAFLHVE